MARKKKFELPDWVGNLPFPPGKKKPAVITPEMEVSTIYGNPPHQIKVHKYVSTDKLTCGDFVVPAGGYFDPPDIHPGDEFYYLLKGTATVFNPATGGAYQVREGEGFLIPGRVWHQVFNFGDENVKILGTIAPAIWSKDEMGSEIEYLEKPKFYLPGVKGVEGGLREESSSSESGMVCIGEGDVLQLVHGEQYHVLVSLFVDADRMQVGKMTLPGDSFSDHETHSGDEMVYALSSGLSIKTADANAKSKSVSQRSHEIGQGGKFLIPGGVEHQYFNFGEQTAVALFSIAPGSGKRAGGSKK